MQVGSTVREDDDTLLLEMSTTSDFHEADMVCPQERKDVLFTEHTGVVVLITGLRCQHQQLV